MAEIKVPHIRNILSKVSLRVETLFDVTPVSIATAFCYAVEGKMYLITNWHVVSGRHHETLRPLSATASIPDRLRLHMPHVKDNSDGTSRWRWIDHVLPLYQDRERAKAVWYEHPVHKFKVDVVAIPLDDLEGVTVMPATDPRLDLLKLKLYPGLDVYILGYPFGIAGGGNLPIWKRGTIASEPEFDVDKLPKLLIDTATRRGMSGAPVYAQEVGLIVTEEGSPGSGSLGKAARFLGIYASRTDSDEFQAQLGVVWKESALLEIIAGKCPGTSSFLLNAA